MKVAALFSGGKDSVYAIYLAQQRGWEIATLVTLMPKRGDSYMFHIPNIHLAPMLAKALGIKIITYGTEGNEETEFEDLKSALTDLDVDGVLTGAIASDYQATRIDRLCHQLDLVCHSPLWRWDQGAVLKDVVDAGFEAMVVGVYAEGLDEKWLGRILDPNAIIYLEALAESHGINISGEGGELETLVLDGPNFLKRVDVLKSDIYWHGYSGELHVSRATLVEKNSSINRPGDL
jgi:diphthine-ammonia ligase